MQVPTQVLSLGSCRAEGRGQSQDPCPVLCLFVQPSLSWGCFWFSQGSPRRPRGREGLCECQLPAKGRRAARGVALLLAGVSAC